MTTARTLVSLRTQLVVAATAAVALSSGCMVERTFNDPSIVEGGFGGNVDLGENSPNFSAGRLTGDVGPIAGFNDRDAVV